MYHRKVLTDVELFQTLLSMSQPRGIVGRNRSVKIVCLDLGNFIASERAAQRIARSMQVGRVRERASGVEGMRNFNSLAGSKRSREGEGVGGWKTNVSSAGSGGRYSHTLAACTSSNRKPREVAQGQHCFCENLWHFVVKFI